MKLTYKDLQPVGTVLIIAATSFGLGCVYSQWPYDLNTLWRADATGEGFARSLAHYALWGNSPMYVHYVFHAIAGLGLMGSFIKLYKPSEDAKYFEYGSLILFMIALAIYLTNLRIGVNSCISGEWGEVDMKTGINVIAASHVMIVIILIGVLVLQGGLYFAEIYDTQLKADFFKEEAEREAKEQAQIKETELKGSSTSSEKNKTKAKKRTA